MTEVMQRRASAVRARAAVRRWEYRQRDTSHGVWLRLRRLLAEAEEAWSVSDAVAQALVAEGFGPERVGEELAPAKTIVFVPRERVSQIAARKPVAVRLDAALLLARCLVLVRFG